MSKPRIRMGLIVALMLSFVLGACIVKTKPGRRNQGVTQHHKHKKHKHKKHKKHKKHRGHKRGHR